MADHYHIGSGAISGTVGGTLLTIMVNINSQDINKTVILGALGATISFTVSLILKEVVKKLWGYIKRREKQD